MTEPKRVPSLELNQPMSFIAPRDIRLLGMSGSSMVSSGVLRKSEVVELENFYTVPFDHHEPLALKLTCNGREYFVLVQELTEELNELCFRLRGVEMRKPVRPTDTVDDLRIAIGIALLRLCRGRLRLVS